MRFVRQIEPESQRESQRQRQYEVPEKLTVEKKKTNFEIKTVKKEVIMNLHCV